MPEYRERVKEVITPKFAASFDKEAAHRRADRRAGRRRRASAEVFATGVSAIDADSATALVAGSFTDSYPKSKAASVRARAGAVPDRGHAWSRSTATWLVDDFTPVTGAEPVTGQAAVSPSWYDLLDVDPDATDDEIRAAWKAAIADLDPADRRFRLLQPGRRGAARPRPRGRRTTPSCCAAEADARARSDTRPSAERSRRAATEAVDRGPAPRVVPGWLLVAVAAARRAGGRAACALLVATAALRRQRRGRHPRRPGRRRAGDRADPVLRRTGAPRRGPGARPRAS